MLPYGRKSFQSFYTERLDTIRVQVKIRNISQMGYNGKQPFYGKGKYRASQHGIRDTGKIPWGITCRHKTAISVMAITRIDILICRGIVRYLQQIVNVDKRACPVKLKKAVLQVTGSLQLSPCFFQCVSAFTVFCQRTFGQAPARHTDER